MSRHLKSSRHRAASVLRGPRHRAATLPTTTTAGPAHSAETRRFPVSRLVQLGCLGVVAALVATLLGSKVVAPIVSNPVSQAGSDQSTLQLAPVADTFVASGSPRQGHGALPYLTASSNRHDGRVAYLRFAIPPRLQHRVVHATLVLTRTSHHLDGTVAVHSVAKRAGSWWGERQLSASTEPTMGPALASQHTGAKTNVVRLDVLHIVKAGRASTFAVTSSLTDGFAQFDSREAHSGTPVLELTLRHPAGVPSHPKPKPQPKPSPSSTAPGTSSSSAPSSSSSSSSSSAPSSPSSSSTSSSSGSAGSNGGLSGFSLGLNPSVCSVSAILVPSCGRYFGIAPQAHTAIPLNQALPMDESLADRTADILHAYHVNGELFPTNDEIAAARGGLGGTQQRLLLENWKPSTRLSWRAVADGQADTTIDAEAKYLKTNFPYKFFLTIWHEPENDVDATPGSGKTAADYAAMYRHVVTRLRNDGVDNAVFVMNYMGFVGWTAQPWFKDLWPGKDFVDWVATDPYAGYQRAQDLDTLVNRPYKKANFPGFYTYLQNLDPGVPMMLAEWGVVRDPKSAAAQGQVFAGMQKELANPSAFPHLKAMVYFDQPGDLDGFSCSPASARSQYDALVDELSFHERISYIH